MTQRVEEKGGLFCEEKEITSEKKESLRFPERAQREKRESRQGKKGHPWKEPFRVLTMGAKPSKGRRQGGATIGPSSTLKTGMGADSKKEKKETYNLMEETPRVRGSQSARYTE